MSWPPTLNGRVRSPESLRPGGRGWGIGAAVLASIIGVVSLLPPRGTPGVEIADLGEVLATIGHALGYALLGALAVGAQTRPRLGTTLAIVIGYGIVLEILQGVMGLRSFQVGDIAANALGAVTGAVVMFRVRRTVV